MAITNAQQFKQLVNPPMKGKKRPGYRGDAAAKSSGAKSQGRVGGSDVGESRTRSDPRDSGPVDRSTPLQDYNTKVALGMLGDEDYETIDQVPLTQTEQMLRDFQEFKPRVKTPPLGIFRFFKSPIQKLSNFTTTRNRKFFEDVIRAGKIPGLNFANLENFTPTQLEKAYQDYMRLRMDGNIDAFGNPIDNRRDDNPFILPLQPIAQNQNETNKDEIEEPDPTRFYRIMADGGMPEDAPMIQGGLTDLAMRDEFFVGGIVKGIKKSLKGVTRAVKKVAKSPIGKAALFAAAGSYGLGLGPFKDMGYGAGFLKNQGLKDFFIKKGGGLTDKGIIAALTATPFIGELLGLNEPKQDENIDLAEGPKLDTEAQPFYRLAAEGGLMRAGYQEGSKEPVAKKTMPLLDMGGQEMDLRDEGGFVPIGRMEKADDVPARLSKNEFVFTADAVRNAGDGNVDKGAEVMYNMMKNLEAGGDVSEESQGLKGAREMFQTSQRLGEVI